MPRRTSSSVEFLRCWEESPVPVYLLDADAKFVFGNAALAQWLNVNLDQLRDAPCPFQSPAAEANELQRIAMGLAPPPAAWQTPSTSGFATRADGAQRAAAFTRISLSPDSHGVLAILAPTDHANQSQFSQPPAYDPSELHRLIAEQRTNLAQRAPLCLLGGSSVAERLRRQFAECKKSRGTLWISGPRGAGKEDIARAIHAELATSPEQPLTTVNCSLLSGEMIVSTMAGALDKKSKQLGTLLLLYVEAMPGESQQQFLSLFNYERNAGQEGNTVRVIATSALTPAQASKEATFVPGFVEILSTCFLELPSLGERAADLPAILQGALEETNAQTEKKRSGFSEEVLETLTIQPWRGELHELRASVAEMHASAKGSLIQTADLPRTVLHEIHSLAHPYRRPQPINLEEVLLEFERRLIDRAITQSKGNKTEAARLLGLPRARLYRRMIALGMISETPDGDPGPVFLEEPSAE